MPVTSHLSAAGTAVAKTPVVGHAAPQSAPANASGTPSAACISNSSAAGFPALAASVSKPAAQPTVARYGPR